MPDAGLGLVADEAAHSSTGSVDGRIEGKNPRQLNNSPIRVDSPVNDLSAERDQMAEEKFSVPELPSSVGKTLNPSNIALINIDNAYQELQFDPVGPSDFKEALNNPAYGVPAGALTFWADHVTENLKEAGRLPKGIAHNNAADAFRHTYWTYQMEKYLLKGAAKAIGDAHERDRRQPLGERLMDLHNNAVGRKLAADLANAKLDDDEVILKALREGKLRITPFNVEATRRSGNLPAKRSKGSY